MRLPALLIAMALFAPGMARAADDGCDFAPPTALLKAHAYAGQTFATKMDHQAVEAATLGGGVKLVVTHGGCVDSVYREFELTAPNDPKRNGFPAWTDFARDQLSRLKLREPLAMGELIDFLKKARTMKPKGGVVKVCRNGTIADECDWDSYGSLSIEVKLGAKVTRVVVSEVMSG